MSKYIPLRTLLQASNSDSIHISFLELEGILGFGLPPSARTRRAWCGNESTPHGHTHCRAWLDAGYKAHDVDLERHTLTFKRVQCAGSRAQGARAKGGRR